MLRIRLSRRGRRNEQTFRLVVAEHSRPIKGKFMEELGYYNPRLKTKSFNQERILYWLKQGANCSATVNNLLVKEGVIQGQKIKAWRPKKKEKTETQAVSEKPDSKSESKKEVIAEEVVQEAPKEEKTPEALKEQEPKE